MKKMLLLCGALLLVGASAALAQAPVGQVKLAFDGCLGDGGVGAKTSTCTANTGVNHLACSILLSRDVLQYQATINEVVVATDGALPTWWGPCTGKAPFVINATAGNMATGCANDAYNGSGSTFAPNLFYNYNGLTNAVMVQSVVANTAGFEVDLLGGTEYFLGDMTFSNAKTTGTGSCAGCATPACINFKTAKIDALSLGANTSINTGGTVGAWVTWQAPASAPNSLACQGATPTRKSTWGSVKALYR